MKIFRENELTTTFDFDGDKEKMLEAAKNQKTSPDVLDYLVRNGWNLKIFKAVANNPNTAMTTLDYLNEKSKSLDVLLSIACHSNTALITFKHLVLNKFKWEHWHEPLTKRKIAIASDCKTPSDILDFLAKNRDSNDVCCAIASNPNTSADILDFLAKSRNSNDVGCAVAGNSNTSVNTLMFLSEKYQNKEMLVVIANHTHAPEVQFLQEVCLHEYDVNYLIELRKLLADIFELEKQTPALNFSVIDNMLVEDIEKFLNSLNELEMNIIMSRWGYNQSFKTFREIASIHNVSQSRIGQIEKQIYGKFWRSTRRVDAEVLCSHIEERITRNSIKLLLPNLSKCFDEEKNFYNFIEHYCGYRESIRNAIEQIRSLKLVKKDSPVTVGITTNKSTGFKIPPPPEPLQFNTARISEIKTESKKVSAMLNAIYEQDEMQLVAEKSAPQATQSVLNLDETHIEIVKILATRSEWERNELQKMMKGMMIDGVLEHINEAFFDYCDEAFIEGDDPIEINVELYKEIFK